MISEASFFLQHMWETLWGVPLISCFFLIALFLNFLLRGMPFLFLVRSFRLLIVRNKEQGIEAPGSLSTYRALMTGVASSVGAGNIVGIATGIVAGGIGAIFWLWVFSLVFMAIKYSEALLAVKFRAVNSRGEMVGGPMYYMEYGLSSRTLALLFSFFAIFTILGCNLVQSASIAQTLAITFSIPNLITGLIFACIIGFILLRGIASVGVTCGILVPLMAIFYIFSGVLGLIYSKAPLGHLFYKIYDAAISGQAACGGFAGATMFAALFSGVSRGIIASEAGLGISSIAAAEAKTVSSARLAMLAMTSSMVLTTLVCTVTGLVIAATDTLGTLGTSGIPLNGAALVMESFCRLLVGGRLVVSSSLLVFGFMTILVWAYYGQRVFSYLFGEKSIPLFRALYLLTLVFGTVFPLCGVYAFANIASVFMALPNLLALFLLSGVVQKETLDFCYATSHGKHPKDYEVLSPGVLIMKRVK
jgi:alanine or glycine:cation symporter, AGCS family